MTGDLVLTQHLDQGAGTYSLTVEHADPRILISSLMLTALTTSIDGYGPLAWKRNATLEPGPPGSAMPCTHDLDPDTCPNLYGGCVLRIYGTNRTVIYRITGRYDEGRWIAEWPD